MEKNGRRGFRGKEFGVQFVGGVLCLAFDATRDFHFDYGATIFEANCGSRQQAKFCGCIDRRCSACPSIGQPRPTATLLLMMTALGGVAYALLRAPCRPTFNIISVCPYF
jgi:hypothetical protein